MIRKIGVIALSAVMCCALGVAAQSQSRQVQSINLVPNMGANAENESYLTYRKLGDSVRVDWIEMQINPAGAPTQLPMQRPSEAARVYYSETPQGGDLSKYNKVGVLLGGTVHQEIFSTGAQGTVYKRYLKFKPEQNGMKPGVYTCIVAYEAVGVTYYSSYFNLMVASPAAPKIVDPSGIAGAAKTIDDLTPTFRWDAVDGVPYYHLILSDEPFPVQDLIDGKGLDGLNISVIWQAITPNNRITYGAPDPTGLITASAPPLSRGKDYMWMVFNNYGNHMIYTDGAVIDLPGMFKIRGEPLKPPRALTPTNNVALNASAEKITFTWDNVDANANSYLVVLSAVSTPGDLSLGNLGDVGDVTASLNVWDTRVSAKGAVGGVLSADLPNPGGILAGGGYVWRVFAEDATGAASTDTPSSGKFTFEGVKSASINIKTVEMVGGEAKDVGFVELKSEVISGTMQAPLAFYTANDGYISRTLPIGTYRLTAVKEGFNTEVVTVTLQEGAATPVTIYLRRPDAVIFGRVADAEDSSWVNSAKITAVSEWGDVVTAQTNSSGSFTLSGREADWTVTIDRAGYITPRARTVTVRQGDNINIGTVYLDRNQFTLSGTVANLEGAPILGARVRVLREGVLVDEIASTPQNGRFSIPLNPGSYTLTAEKAGFTMFSREINMTGSFRQDITLEQNAGMVNGAVIGKSWDNASGDYIYAPVTNASVTFVPTAGGTALTVRTDGTFGNYSLSARGGAFTMSSSASGFVASAGRAVTVTGGATNVQNDTLIALAKISGTIRDNETDAAMGDVDVAVYDLIARRNVAAAKSAVNGRFEIRNIPDGNYIITAGKVGYFLTGAPPDIAVTVGSPVITAGAAEMNGAAVNLRMEEGKRTITWNVTGSERGVVKVISPLNRLIPFAAATPAAPAAPASLADVGPGAYLIEAVAEDNAKKLQISARKFEVPLGDDNSVYTDAISFVFSHVSSDTINLGQELRILTDITGVQIDIDSAALYYRSEGSVRYERAKFPPNSPAIQLPSVRDGRDLQYYFNVYASNGDVYGSDKQTFHSYVRPSPSNISRLSVYPNTPGDTLILPSSYAAAFTLDAFYSSLFLPFSEADMNAIGANVRWGSKDRSTPLSGSGRRFTFNTGGRRDSFTLVVSLPSTFGSYNVSPDADTVLIPVKITGRALASVNINWDDDLDYITNTQRANFSVRAVDDSGRVVTVSPVWDRQPVNAGTISAAGVFTPSARFFGTVRVLAEVPGTGIRTEYIGADSVAGLRVAYALRNRADTVTYRGLRLGFKEGSVPTGESVEFQSGVPDLKNHVYMSAGAYRMADTAYDLSVTRLSRINDEDVELMIDIPEHLRKDAANNPSDFRIARWYADSLKWIILPSSRIVGSAAVARLNRTAVDSINDNARKAASLPKASAAGRRTVAAKSASASAPSDSAASQLHALARYALVMRTRGLSVSVNVSPNPFSPYIRPIKEHGKNFANNRDVPGGTCVKVNIEAPETAVKSLKVHIYTATGKRVWAVEKQNAKVGPNQNDIWWDGRITLREEIWSEDFLERNKKSKMSRNGRYFVTVIVEDIEGRKQRVMKPVVLMK